MKIVLVEDDYTQFKLISKELENEFAGARITVIETEKAFRSSLEEMAKEPPDVFVIDIMLRWTYPQRDHEPAPQDVRDGKFHRAGFRCQRLLEQGDKTKRIPVILYSMVDQGEFSFEARNLPDNVHLMRKEASIVPLATLIRKLAAPG